MSGREGDLRSKDVRCSQARACGTSKLQQLASRWAEFQGFAHAVASKALGIVIHAPGCAQARRINRDFWSRACRGDSVRSQGSSAAWGRGKHRGYGQ